MKESIRTILCVMAGIFLMQLIGAMFFFFTLVSSIAAGSSSAVSVPQNAVLKIDMSKLDIVDKINEENPLAGLSALTGNDVETVGQFDIIRAIDAAAADPSIRFIYLRAEGASNITSLEEIRAALAEFRKSGKSVIAFMDSASTADYYLSSVADKVYMNSAMGSGAMIMGISGRLMFLKDLLDFVGVNMQLIRHGKYKSAGEMYITNKPSEANLEQNRVMVKSLWGAIAGAVSESRGISVEKFNALVDNLELENGADMLEAGLVDALLSRDQMKEKIAELSVVESWEKVNMISLASYIEAKKPGWELKKGSAKVAIIYADGEIVETPSITSQGNMIVGTDFAEIISKVRKDESISAVVFRVNSPGGSVLASDKIKQEMDLLCEAKPVVASYGSYAASGGYWISCGCRQIFANQTTLTGSIGVFSLVPDFGGAVKKAKVNIVPVNSNKHSDMLSGMRALDKDEVAFMQASVEEIYDAFTSVVAAGRGKEADYIDSIGQGRVWTGADALGIGLVDTIGSLKDAVLFAGSLAGNTFESFADYCIEEYPKAKTGMEVLVEMLQPASAEKEIRAQLSAVSPVFGKAFDQLSACFSTTPGTYAVLPYYIDIQ